MKSAHYALKMGREIFVLPQRLGESEGTTSLLKRGEARAIYDIESFVSRFGREPAVEMSKDHFFYFCQSNPTLDEAVKKFGERVYEAELEGKIVVENGKIFIA